MRVLFGLPQNVCHFKHDSAQARSNGIMDFTRNLPPFLFVGRKKLRGKVSQFLIRLFQCRGPLLHPLLQSLGQLLKFQTPLPQRLLRLPAFQFTGRAHSHQFQHRFRQAGIRQGLAPDDRDQTDWLSPWNSKGWFLRSFRPSSPGVPHPAGTNGAHP